MQTGKIIQWNRILKRGMVESRLDGKIYRFNQDCVPYPGDIDLIKEDIQVFFEVHRATATFVEPMSTSFRRFENEMLRLEELGQTKVLK